MSKSTLSLPVPPPPVAPSRARPAILDSLPTPWCIGPFGDIWVDGDVWPKSDIASPNPQDWYSKEAPRHVLSVAEKEADVARLIVDAMNRAYPPAPGPT